MERYGGYTWRQDHDNVIVQIPIPAKLSSKADLDLVITNTTIKAGVKGQPPQLEVVLAFARRLGTRCRSVSALGKLQRPIGSAGSE